MKKGAENLNFPLKEKYVAMLAPSFVVDFPYPKIISQLKNLGFDKIVELTFGAKLVNREYHKILEKSKGLVISSVCPGVVETIKSKYPNYVKNLIPVDSPMIAMAKICRKIYPEHKVVFISPCNFKKIESENSDYVDYTIDYKELKNILGKCKKLDGKNSEVTFDKFYNDYTKIYPIAGGLYKTAHLKNILENDEAIIIDGMDRVMKFLDNPDSKIKFLDVNFCRGGCIGGPCINSKLPLILRRKKVLDYLKIAEKEEIPEGSKGVVKEAKGISLRREYK
ncbi:MAG: [Fe-Fe] hydrogenase large subunit C-terminal domain-containing protein [Candidatus Nanoarchaeia archaeon]|nr:[Fe-Fe] hydrogenase large subunit C-terminal domain-containing protein [Candidatus Nanoarchaeia archaeon]MDD5358041.1 [Fe-Fe] hydrogenase large subunit C-terminal domain-containing protein [Candidatus Nanoarchaeia archaeon]MDD5588960.1 [Fe-Fe] hydrogenase large subunit C-terminal domain-containing protein [Candidatus Nanoarchaeia archaeon]